MHVKLITNWNILQNKMQKELKKKVNNFVSLTIETKAFKEGITLETDLEFLSCFKDKLDMEVYLKALIIHCLA